MRRHGPAGDEEDEPRNEVALRAAVAVLAEPDARQARAPPDDAQGGVLPVVPDPRRAPAVLREGVDAAPASDAAAVEELLRPPGAAHPDLPDQEDNVEKDAVGDEGAPHDEMRSTLAKVIALTKAQCRDAAKDELRPSEQGHGLAHDRVARTDEPPYSAVETIFPVTPKVHAKQNLDDEQEL